MRNKRNAAFELAHELGDSLPGFGQGQFVAWVAGWAMIDGTITKQLESPFIWLTWVELHDRAFINW